MTDQLIDRQLFIDVVRAEAERRGLVGKQALQAALDAQTVHTAPTIPSAELRELLHSHPDTLWSPTRFMQAAMLAGFYGQLSSNEIQSAPAPSVPEHSNDSQYDETPQLPIDENHRRGEEAPANEADLAVSGAIIESTSLIPVNAPLSGEIMEMGYSEQRVGSLLTLLKKKGIPVGDMTAEYFDGAAFGDLERLFRAGYESRKKRTVETKPWHDPNIAILIVRYYLGGMPVAQMRQLLSFDDHRTFPDYQFSNVFYTFIDYVARQWHKEHSESRGSRVKPTLEEYENVQSSRSVEAPDIPSPSEDSGLMGSISPINDKPEKVQLIGSNDTKNPLVENNRRIVFNELAPNQQRAIIASKFEGLFGINGARLLLDRGNSQFSALQIKNVKDLRDFMFEELEIEPEKKDGIGVLRRLMADKMLLPEQLLRVSLFLGFRIETVKGSQTKIVHTEKVNPASVSQIRSNARAAANMAEMDLLTGLHALLDYIENK